MGYRCLICSYLVVLDDAVAPTRLFTCICLVCYSRETLTQKPMPAWLRHQVAEAAAV